MDIMKSERRRRLRLERYLRIIMDIKDDGFLGINVTGLYGHVKGAFLKFNVLRNVYNEMFWTPISTSLICSRPARFYFSLAQDPVRREVSLLLGFCFPRRAFRTSFVFLKWFQLLDERDFWTGFVSSDLNLFGILFKVLTSKSLDGMYLNDTARAVTASGCWWWEW
ncbi:hypothetical protein C1646_821564 [Rhizophagus diaphanus]|nr:hypothetical protein C1646_821564 [Rhizophagus diaphanus] [Rhizophagus sp. MUCL 43196]